jgi:hypothetical protein
MVKSGYFADTRDAAQAIVKILAGREMGFGAFASMTGVYIIQGRPSIGANLMASAVKRSGRYDYKVVELTDAVCEVEYYQAGKTIGKSRFTIEDARKAGTKNLDKFPRNMLFARAMSNGVRWFTPDVFEGAAVYTPEELGADVNEAGDVIEIKVEKVTQPEIKTTAPVIMTREEAFSVETSDGREYGMLTTDDLRGREIGINKALKKDGVSEKAKADGMRKLQAIGIILADREALRRRLSWEQRLALVGPALDTALRGERPRDGLNPPPQAALA